MRKSRYRNNGLQITYERRKGAVIGLQVRGHAGFAAAGEDIVCAAASALVQSAAYGVNHHCHTRATILDTANEFRLVLPNAGNARAQAVLETTISGLRAIASAYPGYLRIKQAKLDADRKTRE